VENTLLAAEVALALELEAADIAAALSRVTPVPGRLQVIAAAGSDAGSDGPEDAPPFTVLVDYAHTPAGLDIVLREARGFAGAEGRVITVFGCGGNRDRAKRPLMGAAAADLSDFAVLTSDNPRDEDPDAIIEDVLRGISEGRDNAGVRVEPDRRVAIALALDTARAGDVVVIAGKGHETYQEIAGERLPFDDTREATLALSARFASAPASWVAGPRRAVGSRDASIEG
jgi:UDP-N-acetylmuramoyl-L-alanyl-D-glutamate--2,6-diaminopimelate ligase